MNRVLISVPSVLLAIVCAACGDDSTTTGGTGGVGMSGGGGTSGAGGGTGVTGGATSAGGGTTSAGGTTGTTGGTTGTMGGSTGTTGGTTGTVGGATGTTGGSSGVTGGSSGVTGGSSGVTGGASGTTGGRTGRGGTTATGGAGGAGGGPTGGGGGASGGGTSGGGTSGGGTSGATGGDSGTGGGQPTGPSVYTSTNGSCVSGTGTTWTPGTISTSTGNATVTVNDTSQSQTWEGIGGSFNELGWKALQALSQADRDRAIQLLFGPEGARFVIGRIPIGASDYAIARYTDDEGGVDTAMANFNTTQDEKNLIPYIKAAMAVKPDIRFWASPWTPPTWMKKEPFTADTDGGGTTSSKFDSGHMDGSDANLGALAQYFVKWIAAYKAQGINVTMVAPQNEPNYALHYPTCIWASADYTKFVGQFLGPALAGTGVSVMLGTLSNADSGKDVDLANAALNDAAAKPFFTAVGVQWNVLDKVNGGTKFGSLPIWASEHKCGNYPWSGATGCGDGASTSCPAYNSAQAPNDQAYGVESWYQLRNAITKGGITAYNAWNMVLDSAGLGIDDHRDWKQNALLVAAGSTLKVTSAYCVFRHISQFVAVGAKRVGTSGGDAMAFKNPDGSLVAVMYNSGAANSAYVVSIGGQKLEFSMPAAGWATVVSGP
ncbi:MAG: glucosylceramidase [Polyangiaceae bacterium]|nr:glucosylceramidase [Polyangiaceae bacterium]